MSVAGEVVSGALKFGAGHMALIGILAGALGLCSGYVFWHEHVFNKGKDEGLAICKAASDQAELDHANAQGQISGAATTQNPKIEAKVNALSGKLDTLIAEARKPPQVFHDCAPLPPDQVAGYNGIH